MVTTVNPSTEIKNNRNKAVKCQERPCSDPARRAVYQLSWTPVQHHAAEEKNSERDLLCACEWAYVNLWKDSRDVLKSALCVRTAVVGGGVRCTPLKGVLFP